MALLVTTENKPVFLPAQQGNLLWLISTGERKGSPAARAKVKRIKRFYLNRATAPASYLEANPPTDDTKPQIPDVSQVRLPYVD